MITTRRAGRDDVDAVVELRRVMFEAMGAEGTGWEGSARSWFLDALEQPGRAAVIVVDEGDGPVACALGIVTDQPPSPTNPSGVVGWVLNVATLPTARRRGHARRAVTALLTWFDEETPARVVRLDATGEGRGLYDALGFTAQAWPAMRRRRP